MKRNLTDKFVRNLRAAPPGKRVDHWDTAVPGFGIRVTDRGAKSYVVYVRWPGSGSPSRRTVGNAARMSLAAARTVARDWLALIEKGIDPQEQARKAAVQAQQKRDTKFASVVGDWFASAEFKATRKVDEVKRCVELEFVKPWGKLPVTDIRPLMIHDLILAKAEGKSPAPGAKKTGPAPAQARNMLIYIKVFFSWVVLQRAMELHDYGLAASPAAPLRPDKILGKKRKRSRVLRPTELRALWNAACKLEYPYGPIVKLLMLTGLRRSEVAKARWEEFDMLERLWTIPEERMKMKEPHEVALTEEIIAIVRDDLPTFQDEHLFSTSFGKTPANGFSKAKKRIDALMLQELGAAPPHWTFHDIRRTVRSGMSPLPIEDHVIERVLAHKPTGMREVYDHHDYRDEKREALDLWAASLRKVLLPPEPSNVVLLKISRAR